MPSKLADAALASYGEKGGGEVVDAAPESGELEAEMQAFCAAVAKKDYAAMARAFREAANLA